MPESSCSIVAAGASTESRFGGTALILVSGDERKRDSCKADRFVLKGGSMREIEGAISEALKAKAV